MFIILLYIEQPKLIERIVSCNVSYLTGSTNFSSTKETSGLQEEVTTK